MQSTKSSSPSHTPAQAQPAAVGDIAFPYEISFVDCSPSAAVRFQIEEHLARLSPIYNRITDAKVTVRIPHKHSAKRFFQIHIQLDVPGRRLAVSRNPDSHKSHTTIPAVIHGAFHKLTRQLEDFLDVRKAHGPVPELTVK